MISVEIKKETLVHPRNPNPKVTEGERKLTGSYLEVAGKVRRLVPRRSS
jgi:hypothetical protein